MEYWYQFQLSAEVKMREKLHFGISKIKGWQKDQFLGLDALYIKLFIYSFINQIFFRILLLCKIF